MGTESIGFRSPPPRDSCGMVTPSESTIPVMRGNKATTIKGMLKRLDEALDGLAYTPCSFWACRGPKRPKAMVTCCKCSAMRDVAITRAALALRLSQERK